MAKKKNLRERMLDKKEELKKKKNSGFILRQKEEGTIRFRVLPVGEDNDFVKEITYFWLNNDLGEIVSPATIGEPCPAMEKYHELNKSNDSDDKELAKKLVPRKKYVLPVIMYKDQKGKEIDLEQSNRLLQVTGGIYQEVIDLYLDEDEWGDMTDPKDGYDLKQTRTGKGKNDTTYTIQACKNTPIHSDFKKTKIDLEEMVSGIVDTYDSALEKLEKFLGNVDSTTDDEDDEDNKKSKKKPKKKRSTDYDDDEEESPRERRKKRRK